MCSGRNCPFDGLKGMEKGSGRAIHLNIAGIALSMA